jgi:hypothetical protein
MPFTVSSPTDTADSRHGARGRWLSPVGSGIIVELLLGERRAGRISSGAARRYHLVAVPPLDFGAMLTADRS